MGKNSAKKRKEAVKQTIKAEVYGLLLLFVSLLTLSQKGWFGEKLSLVCRFFAGTYDFMIPLLGIAIAVIFMVKRNWPNFFSMRWLGVGLMLFSLLLFNHLLNYDQMREAGAFDRPASVITVTWEGLLKEWSGGEVQAIGGGIPAAFAFYLFIHLFERAGTLLVICFMLIIGVMLTFDVSFIALFKKLREMGHKLWSKMKNKAKEARELVADQSRKPAPEESGADWQQKPSFFQRVFKRSSGKEEKIAEDDAAAEDKDVVIHDFADVAYSDHDREEPDAFTQAQEKEPQTHASDLSQEKETEVEETETSGAIMFEQETENEDYMLPPLSLLDRPQKSATGRERRDIYSNAGKLKKTLESFGVHAEVTQIHRGPTVTRYEVQPAIGVKVSKIVNLSDDLALALAAKDIRIEAPIPGKSAIGIEVPNQEVSLVTQREVLESSQYHEAKSKLSVALGRDISGEPIVMNLAKMPHLLVAGATGSGKSVCINGIVTSLLYKAKPHEVKLMMIDPKMVELNVYNGIPHLLSPVVTDPKRAAMALKKVVAEMERRYKLFAESGTRDIERYNELASKNSTDGQPYPLLPYIVVIVDELADLMMVSPGDVEDAICRLAQMARAAGIHLIIATQRPSVDVITGVIKANIPSRIAFGVSSQVDSRTILDMSGAEKLLGRGDMLYLPVGASKPIRVQGAFISEAEVEKLVSFVKGQQKAHYHDEMIPDEKEESEDEAQVDDELYETAVQMVIEAQRASVSLLQRRLRIGYTRAARLIDAMEANGIVGPYEGSKPRELLVKKDESQIS